MPIERDTPRVSAITSAAVLTSQRLISLAHAGNCAVGRRLLSLATGAALVGIAVVLEDELAAGGRVGKCDGDAHRAQVAASVCMAITSSSLIFPDREMATLVRLMCAPHFA